MGVAPNCHRMVLRDRSGRPSSRSMGNPMFGWRGASRYYSGDYRDGCALECRADRRAREDMGLANVMVMVPFCRTPEGADRVLETMAEEFAARVDGLSIGSNDLTLLVLAVDRDSSALAHPFDETNEPSPASCAT